jgi:predicted alpha/beta-fold hydrolase
MLFRATQPASARSGTLKVFLPLIAFAVIAASPAFSAQPVLTSNNQPDCELPAYDFRYKNGLYATIAGFLNIKDFELKNQKTIKLKVESFKKKVPVRAIVQRQSAPLVVVLLGVDGKADGALGKLWPAWFASAGYHVLTFDSTFQPTFTELSGHGVTGNIRIEAERVKDLIASFLELGEMKGKVSKIGVVGMSYGGLEALVLGQMAADKQLPFALEAVQSYSPPIKLQATGELIDRWYAEDRWQYTLTDLASKLSGHKPVSPDSEIPFSDSVMRAGIAAVFRLGLVDVIVRNDQFYKLNALPSGSNYDDQYVKRDYASVMGYSKFMSEISYPYWQRKLSFQNLSDLMGPIELRNLVEKQLPTTQVIISEDDPFNTPEDLAELKSQVNASSNSNVTFLNYGGHLGFVNEAWTKAKLLSLFKPAAPQTSAVELHK